VELEVELDVEVLEVEELEVEVLEVEELEDEELAPVVTVIGPVLVI